jgi:hypothetical protein
VTARAGRRDRSSSAVSGAQTISDGSGTARRAASSRCRCRQLTLASGPPLATPPLLRLASGPLTVARRPRAPVSRPPLALLPVRSPGLDRQILVGAAPCVGSSPGVAAGGRVSLNDIAPSCRPVIRCLTQTHARAAANFVRCATVAGPWQCASRSTPWTVHPHRTQHAHFVVAPHRAYPQASVRGEARLVRPVSSDRTGSAVVRRASPAAPSMRRGHALHLRCRLGAGRLPASPGLRSAAFPAPRVSRRNQLLRSPRPEARASVARVPRTPIAQIRQPACPTEEDPRALDPNALCATPR